MILVEVCIWGAPIPSNRKSELNIPDRTQISLCLPAGLQYYTNALAWYFETKRRKCSIQYRGCPLLALLALRKTFPVYAATPLSTSQSVLPSRFHFRRRRQTGAKATPPSCGSRKLNSSEHLLGAERPSLQLSLSAHSFPSANQLQLIHLAALTPPMGRKNGRAPNLAVPRLRRQEAWRIVEALAFRTLDWPAATLRQSG